MSIDDKVLESGGSQPNVIGEFALFFLASHMLTSAISGAARYAICKKSRPNEGPIGYYLHCYHKRFWKADTLKFSAPLAIVSYSLYSVLK